ncbi:unnamed protein product [Ceutorhynchus assimilis]|uniref:Centrosomal protein of 290 kDa n=1 Tax=Ceutorhynchus assimilis TaxID=467358 RepID=A0A9N9MCA5_9CUCU|nr:unnamed protein product [Ceutorhynchus assimilis]
MSALEYENLEQKYIETKTKLKKTLKYNERHTIQIEKLTKKCKRLEQENKHLENQIDNLQTKDASESDTSSQTNFHQDRSHMIELVHSKNQQISDLLKDIEDSENENVILREKLSEAKDQLATATIEITTMTETLKNYEIVAKERDETINTTSLKINQLQLDLNASEGEKNTIEKQLKLFIIESKQKEEEWKSVLIEKDEQIQRLKASIPAVKGSPSAKDEDQSSKELHMREVEKLKAALSKTEVYLEELKSEMKNCTVDLRESARVINKLKSEKHVLEIKLKEMIDCEKDMKEQLKKAQNRSKTLQTEVEYANKMTKIFENDLTTIKNHIKENDGGQIEALVNLEQIQTLKIEKFLHEKQIVGLVKDINKLQEMCNIFEIENASLRKQLGLTAEDTVETDKSSFSESKRQKKLIEKLQIENKSAQEDKVMLKLENKRLKQRIANLLNSSSENLEKNMSKGETGNQSADIKALAEENEALRKGLHEILVKNETCPRELKSDILERLLKALDVKHIPAWNHPAMRLQAELNTLEGVNSELREQLHGARAELDKFKLASISLKENQVEQADTRKEVVDVLSNNLNNETSNLEQVKIHIMKIITYFSEKESDAETKLEEEFGILKQHINLLHSNCDKEKNDLIKKLDEFEKNALEAQGYPETDLNNKSPEELRQVINTSRTKEKYLFKQMNNLQQELLTLKSNHSSLNKTGLMETEMLLKTNQFLRSKINLREKQIANLISPEAYKEVQNTLNENIKKYRTVMMEVERQKGEHDYEIEVLKRKEMDLNMENTELKDKLNKSLTKLSQEVYKHDKNVLSLSEKLASTEIQAISEKHRADHTNNLYELVKEQLKKSEEKFLEFSKYSEGLLQKNLVLQEQIAALEDQVSIFIDPTIYKELETSLNSLLQETETIRAENNEIEKKYQEQCDCIQQTSNWNKEKEQELLGLKHKIVDLSITSDDKVVIEQLHNDLSKSRSELRDQHLQVDFLRKEVAIWETRWTKLCSEFDSQRNYFEIKWKVREKKIEILQDIILKHRVQYHGCVPLAIQELFVEKLNSLNKEKHDLFIASQNTGKTDENEEGKHQINYLQQKILNQDMSMAKLEKELFSAYNLMDFDNTRKETTIIRRKAPTLVKQLVSQESLDPIKEEVCDTKRKSKIVILRNVESQTEDWQEDKGENQLAITTAQIQNLQSQLAVKGAHIKEKEQLLAETQEELKAIKEQIKDKNVKIISLENNLIDYKDRVSQIDGARDAGVGSTINYLEEQNAALRMSLKYTQDKMKQKDFEIIKYQTVIKDDRDKHSLAAANLQKELTVSKKALAVEHQHVKSLQEKELLFQKKSAAVEQYMSQVRGLEKHLAELHTQVAQLQIQLQNSNQEATRWRQMAQDRLVAMQELGKSLNEQHNKELDNFKTDYERLKTFSKESTVTPKTGLGPNDPGYIAPEILKLCREKDQKIEELTAKLEKREGEKTDKKSLNLNSDKHMNKEIDTLRSKYKEMVDREKVLKDDLKVLTEKLSKQSNSSVRSQKSERTVKEQLQKKIKSLEDKIKDLNEQLAHEQILNENHRLSASEDYEKWKKQKYWQENCEKYKNKFQASEEELLKMREACKGYRLIIDRLEKEKLHLENRNKSLKSDQRNLISDQENALLKEENDQLISKLEALQAKIDMLQHGSGALGAALMQEKLEGQERKIAVLELSAKGTIEVRNELERLQASLTNLQKKNLCLEAENLELQMDLEKYSNEAPHLQEQIQHLENYIELLKNENQSSQASNVIEAPSSTDLSEDKKVPQLERTVFILKRVVEKLQAENKRLVTVKRPLSDRSHSADKIRRDHLRLKDQHVASLQKIKELESQLQSVRKQKSLPGDEMNEHLRKELTEVKEHLAQKTVLLEKVKSLLHAAAAREKQLLQDIHELKCPGDMERDISVDIPSTIEEVSEVSSDV